MVRGLIQSDALAGCELAEYADHARDRYRCAVYVGPTLVASLAYAPYAARPDWETAKSLFAEEEPEAAERRANAEHLEEVPRHEVRLNERALAAGADRQRVHLPGREPTQRMRAICEILIVGI